MRLPALKYLAVVLVVLFVLPLDARPFVRIHKIETKAFPEIQVYVTVSNLFQQPFRGLSEKNFTLKENDWRVNYLQSRPLDEDGQGKDVVIALYSGLGQSEKNFNRLRQAAAHFIDSLQNHDRAALVSFDSGPFLHSNFSSDFALLKTELSSMQRRNKASRVYDALYFSSKLAESSMARRRAVVLFTTRGDHDSTMDHSDVIGLAGRIGSPVYVVAPAEADGLRPLKRTAHKTGGELIAGLQPEGLIRLFSMVGSLLEHQYVLQYRSQAESLAAGDSEHPHRLNIEVGMEHGNLKDSDSRLVTVERMSKWRGLLSGDLFLFIAGALLIVFLLIIVLVLVKKDRVTIEINDESEEALRKALENRSLQKIEQNADRYNSSHDGVPESKPLALKAFLVERGGRNTGQKVPLYWNLTTLGRAADNTIVIDEDGVSAYHAKIQLHGTNLVLYDTVSDNGVFLNGKKLLRPRELNDMDEIRIGRHVYLYRAPVESHWEGPGGELDATYSY